MLQLPLYQPPNINHFFSLEFFNSIFSFTPDLVWFAVGLVGIFFVVFSFILSYHWKKFGLDTIIMAKAALIYFSVSTMLIITMVVAMMVYLTSI